MADNVRSSNYHQKSLSGYYTPRQTPPGSCTLSTPTAAILTYWRLINPWPVEYFIFTQL